MCLLIQAYGDQQYPHTGGHFGGDYDTETTSATNTASESEGGGGGGGGEGAMFSETDFDCSTIKSDSTYGLNNKGEPTTLESLELLNNRNLFGQ